MAGNYPDLPDYRLAYDADGSRVFSVVSGTPTEQSSSTKQNLNSENTTYANVNLSSGNKVVWEFPYQMDVTYIWLRTSSSVNVVIETSNDSTNGEDGTWSTAKSSFSSPTAIPNPAWRLSANQLAISAANVRWLRIRATSGSATLSKMFLFGKPHGDTDRLAFWHETNDEPVPPNFLEWGDRPRNSSAPIKKFRIKNLSDTYTATAVRVAQQVLYDASVSVPGQHRLSQNEGLTWGAQQTVGDLEPGEISIVVWVQQNLTADAVLWLWAHRLFTEANTWEVAA